MEIGRIRGDPALMKVRIAVTIAICAAIIVATAWLWLNERLGVKELRIAVGPAVGYTYELGEAFSQVIAANNPRIHIVLCETEGMQQSIDELRSGKVDMAIATMSMGVGVNIRTVALLYPDLFHLVARRASGIRSVENLKGRRVLVPSEGTIAWRDFHSLLQHYGMNNSDLVVREFRASELKKASLSEIEKQKVDAIYASLPLGEPLMRRLVRNGDWQLIPIDQGASMKITMPYLAEFKIPRGTYRASAPAVPDRDLETVGTQTALFVHSTIHAWAVYDITRILFEHQNELIARTPLAALISSPDKTRIPGPEVHCGALAYYNRGQPDVIKKYYNEICFFFTLGPMLLSVLMAIRARLQSKRLKRIDGYTRKIAELFMEIDSSADLQSLIGLERELLKLFAQSLKDLEGGRLTTNDINSLSMIWDKAIDAVHHRQAVWARKG